MGQESLRKVFASKKDMAQAAAQPLVSGEQLDPPNYAEVWTEEASQLFHAAYLDDEERLHLPNAQGVVRHGRVSVGQLIPTFIHRCFAGMRQDRRVITSEESPDNRD